MNRTWVQTELRHHRDYVTALADLRFIIVKRNGNLPDKWIDTTHTTP